MHVHGNFAFYHIPKTGGTSVRKLLYSTGLPFKQVTKDHAPITRWRTRRWLRKCKHVYTNVRDPFARVVSLYQFSNKPCEELRIDFKKFFYEHWFPNPKKIDWLKSTEEFLLLDGKVPENITIIKLEEIDKVWPRIIEKHFGKKVLSVPQENRTLHNKPITYFDEEMIKLVHEKEKWACNYYCL